MTKAEHNKILDEISEYINTALGMRRQCRKITGSDHREHAVMLEDHYRQLGKNIENCIIEYSKKYGKNKRIMKIAEKRIKSYPVPDFYVDRMLSILRGDKNE